MYILTHFLTSQPALIKLDNENIGGHLTPLQLVLGLVMVRALIKKCAFARCAAHLAKCAD